MQKLAYAGVVFVLAPFQILTGAAQSPAIEARFPWYVQMWGGRQWARSLHFLGLVAFLGLHRHPLCRWSSSGAGVKLTASMIFGSVRNTNWATALSLVIIAADHRHPRRGDACGACASPRSGSAQVLEAVVGPARLMLLRPLNSRQNYPDRITHHAASRQRQTRHCYRPSTR